VYIHSSANRGRRGEEIVRSGWIRRRVHRAAKWPSWPAIRLNGLRLRNMNLHMAQSKIMHNVWLWRCWSWQACSCGAIWARAITSRTAKSHESPAGLRMITRAKNAPPRVPNPRNPSWNAMTGTAKSGRLCRCAERRHTARTRTRDATVPLDMRKEGRVAAGD
jgi:hypothetical protein